MDELKMRLGKVAADNLIAHAMEELAVQLSHAEEAFFRGKNHQLREISEQISAIAGHVGMDSVRGVADNVAHACAIEDPTALAAVMDRMRRVGETALLEIWDIQDLSG